ncbi:hypothetical protein KIL84_015786 [Mauremys mutica]|uniref:Uncharacterized protein n=1 Tax=Mauremys mutica TaxID=74926 RepID=A0A9D3WMR9_9SAUR|nr:hypothetical protein KIL84_015786 [Mauremys mutica]
MRANVEETQDEERRFYFSKKGTEPREGERETQQQGLEMGGRKNRNRAQKRESEETPPMQVNELSAIPFCPFPLSCSHGRHAVPLSISGGQAGGLYWALAVRQLLPSQDSVVH